MAYRQVKGDVVYNTASGPQLIVAALLEDENGDIVNGTACTITVYDHTGTSVIANGDFNTAPTETAINTWYAILSDAAAEITAGKTYWVKVAITDTSVYTKWFSFTAPN